MTLTQRSFITVALMASFSGSAYAECTPPASPIIPDGNVASMDELVSAQKALKQYQTDVLVFRECLQGLDEAIDADAEDAAAQRAGILEKFNGSVDAETALAEEFNGAVKAF